MNFNNIILFTGAGFTANFGGFLSKEMWSKIFNNPKLNNAGNLKLELRKNFDFEDVYSRVLNDQIPNLQHHEKEIYVNSLNEAYLELDKAIKSTEWTPHGINPVDLRKFLDFFSQNDQSKISLCFTLNQDLFMERHIGWQPLAPPTMRFKGTRGNLDRADLDSNTNKILPTEKELEDYKNSCSDNFFYVKLHGSQKWIASDGKDTKILGINKREAIENIPLLKWYFSLFEQALFRSNIKLIVIGYSFKDEDINNCIITAINKFRLKLYVISTEDPEKFSFRITHKQPWWTTANELDNRMLSIWNAIDGYFPYKLKKLFPISQIITSEKIEVFKSIGIPLIT